MSVHVAFVSTYTHVCVLYVRDIHVCGVCITYVYVHVSLWVYLCVGTHASLCVEVRGQC